MVDAKRPIKGTHDAGVGKARELNNDLREQGRKEAGPRDLKSTLRQIQSQIPQNRGQNGLRNAGLKGGKSGLRNSPVQDSGPTVKAVPIRSDAVVKTGRAALTAQAPVIHKPLSPKAQASGFEVKPAQPNLQQLLQTRTVPGNTASTIPTAAAPIRPQPQTPHPSQHAATEAAKPKTAVPENQTPPNGPQTKTAEASRFVPLPSQSTAAKSHTEEPKRNDGKNDSDQTAATKKGAGILARAQRGDTKDRGSLDAALGGSTGEATWNPGFEVYGAVKGIEKKIISVLERARIFARDIEKRVAPKNQQADPQNASSQDRTEMTKTEEGRINARANVYGKIGA